MCCNVSLCIKFCFYFCQQDEDGLNESACTFRKGCTLCAVVVRLIPHTSRSDTVTCNKGPSHELLTLKCTYMCICNKQAGSSVCTVLRDLNDISGTDEDRIIQVGTEYLILQEDVHAICTSYRDGG